MSSVAGGLVTPPGRRQLPGRRLWQEIDPTNPAVGGLVPKWSITLTLAVAVWVTHVLRFSIP